jgi:hypothetical protein
MRELLYLVTSAVTATAWRAPAAHADRYEAEIAVRPAGEIARIAERGTGELAVVRGEGGAGGLNWGFRNWLNVGGELAVSAFEQASYQLVTLPVGANPRTGSLSRRTQTMQLRGLATLRLGVGWVPTIQLAAGLGARRRSAAQLRTEAGQQLLVFVPDGEGAELSLDLVAGVRIGLDRRLTRHWTIGASVGGTHCLGVAEPDMQFADASISISYNWYQLWW